MASGSSSYLAPSRSGYGWGVFASKSFQRGDIVDMAPMFLRVDLEENRAKVLKETVLNNYHYEYWYWDGIRGSECQYSMISFGMTLYYNHQSPPAGTEEGMSYVKDSRLGPNIEQRKVGKEPDIDAPDRAVAIVYYALRDIDLGEELLVDYGGSEWFEERGMHEIVADATAEEANTSSSQGTVMLRQKQDLEHQRMLELAGQVMGGYHQEAFRRVMDSAEEALLDDCQPYRLETLLDYLPSERVCFGNVLARRNIQEGQTIEFVPALLLQKLQLKSTILEPLGFVWRDFDDASPAFSGGRPEHVQLQYQPDADEIVPPKHIQIKSIEATVFALAGTISLMSRSNIQNRLHNAVLQIEDDPCNVGGYCVRAVACQSIDQGDQIRIGVHSWEPSLTERILEELSLTGQPFDVGQEET